MKKKLILVLLFFITGCSSKLNFNNEINRIKYNNNNIYYQDYDTIINDLNSIKWNCVKNDNNYNESNLIINTKDSIMNFYFSNNYYMEYKNNNKYCYTKNKKVLFLELNYYCNHGRTTFINNFCKCLTQFIPYTFRHHR